MTEKTTRRPTTRAARAEKSAQARAQREANAKKAEERREQETPETPEVETPKTPDATPDESAPGFESPETVETPSSDLSVGQVFDEVPAKGGGGSRPSVWTDRINQAVDQLVTTDKANGKAGVVMHVAPTPKTATNTANKIRKMIDEGRLTGLVENGTISLVSRGKAILVTFKSA